MTTRTIDDIDFSALSATERLELAQILLESVLYDARTEPLSVEQLAELDRRLEAADAGNVAFEPWDQARGGLQRKQ